MVRDRDLSEQLGVKDVDTADQLESSIHGTDVLSDNMTGVS